MELRVCRERSNTHIGEFALAMWRSFERPKSKDKEMYVTERADEQRLWGWLSMSVGEMEYYWNHLAVMWSIYSVEGTHQSQWGPPELYVLTRPGRL